MMQLISVNDSTLQRTLDAGEAIAPKGKLHGQRYTMSTNPQQPTQTNKKPQ